MQYTKFVGMNYITVQKYILDCGYTISYQNQNDGVFIIDNKDDGIQNLIIGVAPPILIFEMYLFTLKEDNLHVFKSLLIKNRDILHGAFALNEDGTKVIYRYSIQIANLDFNEFEAAVTSLGLLLSEYSKQLIDFSKT